MSGDENNVRVGFGLGTISQTKISMSYRYNTHMYRKLESVQVLAVVLHPYVVGVGLGSTQNLWPR